ncbi:hypothetical protein [Trinickia sp.]|uniref:hypothetical protein n=1 Tax=Trinickia sp. TaxID=2571163 RepID=UPI003F809003
MARSAKEARDSAAQEEVAETNLEPSLSAALAQILVDVPPGPAHGALIAIETSLVELKRRAMSVSEHLSDDEYASILERINAL